MMEDERPPVLVGLFTYLSWMFLFLLGHIRDFFRNHFTHLHAQPVRYVRKRRQRMSGSAGICTD